MPTHKWKDLKDSRFPIMECGCRANGSRIIRNDTDPNDKKEYKIPCCVTHSCIELARVIPNLEGRKARCPDCQKIVDSSFNLPFFQYRPDHYQNLDSWYCGCRGWD